jgi:hypothetical protein
MRYRSKLDYDVFPLNYDSLRETYSLSDRVSKVRNTFLVENTLWKIQGQPKHMTQIPIVENVQYFTLSNNKTGWLCVITEECLNKHYEVVK